MVKPVKTASVLALSASGLAFADCGWTPPGPIVMKIAFASGGGADTQARTIAAAMEEKCGWTVVPKQVTGAGGLNLAVDLANDPADGTSIGLLVTESLGYNNHASGSPVSINDFTAINTTASFQLAIVAPASAGWTSFDQVLAAAAEGEVRFGTMSQKLSDLAFLLADANGVDLNIVQGRGGRFVLDAIRAGDLDLGYMAGIQAGGVASGELVELLSAIGGPLANTPDAPFLSDYGVDFDAAGWFAFIGPAGLPADAVAALESVIADIVNDPHTEACRFIERAFGGPSILGAEGLAARIADEYAAAYKLAAAVETAEAG